MAAGLFKNKNKSLLSTLRSVGFYFQLTNLKKADQAEITRWKKQNLSKIGFPDTEFAHITLKKSPLKQN